jgi:GxxExxY protein
MTEDEIGKIVVSASVRLHRELGPGLLESVYEILLADELRRAGLLVRRQVPVAIEHNGFKFREGFRADLVIENKVLIELKCVGAVNKAHQKQLLTYLRLTGLKLGFLLNFGAALMREGIMRVVNGLEEHR